MNSPVSKVNRIPLVCTKCVKNCEQLSVHLARVCMKKSSPEEIAAVVKEARQSMIAHLLKGRIYSYDNLNQLFNEETRKTVINMLETNGCFVIGKPQVLILPTTSGEDTETEHLREEEEEETAELYQPPSERKWLTTIRKKVNDAGLYRKHSLDCKLLVDFRNYLKNDLSVSNCKQELENVARFLFFYDPESPTLNFIKDIPRTRAFFNLLKSTGLAQQTIINYMKNIKRFVHYHIVATDMREQDNDLYTSAQHFQCVMKDMQKKISRGVSKEVTQRRYQEFRAEKKTPGHCLLVLDKAKEDFLKVIEKLSNNQEFAFQDTLLVLYYLEALLLLKHVQRPCVVKNFQAKEWIERRPHHDEEGAYFVIVAVKEHKTAAQQIASFCLSCEEEQWFEQYFTNMRPLMLGKKRTASKNDAFFVSSKGDPIYNPSNDLNRFQERYNVPSVTSQQARRVYETATKKDCTDAEKSLVADYMAHSTHTAEKHYRMMRVENICAASKLLNKLSLENPRCLKQEPTMHFGAPLNGRKQRAHRNGKSKLKVPGENIPDVPINFEKEFPVTLNGNPPSKTERSALAGDHERQVYDKWRLKQQLLRKEEIMKHFPRRQPTVKLVLKFYNKMKWIKNVPEVAELIQSWKPIMECTLSTVDKQINSCLHRQRWSGVSVTDEDGTKKVITNRIFLKGEVICDFHGELKSADDGIKKINGLPKKEMNKLLFFTDSWKAPYCIDATNNPCSCHPLSETPGRLMQTSKKTFNVKPVLETFDVDGKLRYVILFVALQTIMNRCDLTYDYSLSTRAHRGHVPQWID